MNKDNIINREKEDFSKPSSSSSATSEAPTTAAAAAASINNNNNMGQLRSMRRTSSSDEDRLSHLIAASHQPDFAGLEETSSTHGEVDSLRQFFAQQHHHLSHNEKLLPAAATKQQSRPSMSLLLPSKDVQLRHVTENVASATNRLLSSATNTSSMQLDNNNNPESLYNYKLAQFEGHHHHQSSATAAAAAAAQSFGQHQQQQSSSSNSESSPTIILDADLLLPPRLKRKMDESTEVIDQANIQLSDVLLERGGRGNHHEGSKHYRRLINENREAYQSMADGAKERKMAISVGIIQTLKASGARFIHRKKGQYIIMNDREARNKISQALREKKKRVMLDD